MIFSETILYRYGGDEFVAVLHSNRHKNDDSQYKEEINKAVEHVRMAFKEPIRDLHNHDHYVDLSMGIISKTVAVRDWTLLICLADKLMYVSKEKRGHTTICYTQEDLKELMSDLGQSNAGDVDRC